jgi:hypothetical protein
MSADTADTSGLDLDADDESVEEKRLKEMFARKSDCIDTRDDAKLAATQNPNAEREALSAYRSAIESYVSAIQPLLNQGSGPTLWSQKEYGTVWFEPPGQSARGDGWQLPNGDTVPSKPDPKPRKVIGLQTLFNADDPLQELFSIEYDVKHQHKQSVSFMAASQISWGILDSMLIDLNNLLHESGLTINEATDSEADADYSDIL